MRSLLLDDILMDYVSDPQNWTWYDDRGWFRNTYGAWGATSPMIFPEELLAKVRGVTCTVNAWTTGSSQYLAYVAYQAIDVIKSDGTSVRMGSSVPGYSTATLDIHHGDAGHAVYYSSQIGIPASVEIPPGVTCTGLSIGSGGFYENGIYYNILSRGLKDITLHF